MNKTFAVAEVKALEGENPNGEFEVILSAPTLDRDGEVIDAKAFEPLPEHITFDIDHGLSTATTVGSGTPYYDGDLLKVKGSFSSRPLAQELRSMVQEGHIRTTSVAFMKPKREMKDGIPHIVKAELLNGAFVAVPSNREAAVLAVKSFSAEVEKQLKAFAGSYEERREQIRDAIQEANPEGWVYVLATFEDSVVYEIEGVESGTFRTTYSLGDEGLTLGAPEAVEVSEVITPKSVDDTEKKSNDTESENEAAADAAAIAAASAAVDTPVDVIVAQAEAIAEATLALLQLRAITQPVPSPDKG